MTPFKQIAVSMVENSAFPYRFPVSVPKNVQKSFILTGFIEEGLQCACGNPMSSVFRQNPTLGCYDPGSESISYGSNRSTLRSLSGIGCKSKTAAVPFLNW